MTTLQLQSEAASPTQARRDQAWDAFKVAAFALMVLDHLAYFAQWPEAARIPGRLVFPMFAGMLACKAHRYSRGGMVNRLLVWGCIAQAVLLPIGWPTLNVLFTLGAGLWIAEQRGNRLVYAFVGLLAYTAFETAVGRHLVEYGAWGVFMVSACRLSCYYKGWWVVAFAAVIIANPGGVELKASAGVGVAITYAFIERHQIFRWVRRVPTYAWYALYPVHLLILWGLTRL